MKPSFYYVVGKSNNQYYAFNVLQQLKHIKINYCYTSLNRNYTRKNLRNKLSVVLWLWYRLRIHIMVIFGEK